MEQFTLRTIDQLPILLRAFRKEAGMTQSAVALRLGVTQQTYSAFERNAETVSAARLLKLLNILHVEWKLSKRSLPDIDPTDLARSVTGDHADW